MAKKAKVSVSVNTGFELEEPIMRISFVGDNGNDITPIIEEVARNSESFRLSIQRFTTSVRKVGWRCGELKEMVPGIWAVRVS